MKARITARAALALGLRSLARDAVRFGRERRALISETRREARRGCAPSAAVLILLLLAL
nr:hypothetical protein [Methylobacterium sp. L1A1]